GSLAMLAFPVGQVRQSCRATFQRALRHHDKSTGKTAQNTLAGITGGDALDICNHRPTCLSYARLHYACLAE
ncbi:MAG: hypothetical protein OXE85_02210, partial [Roseovarius sp.]|nr:hypothetical protein [Roseovarius sp.]